MIGYCYFLPQASDRYSVDFVVPLADAQQDVVLMGEPLQSVNQTVAVVQRPLQTCDEKVSDGATMAVSPTLMLHSLFNHCKCMQYEAC